MTVSESQSAGQNNADTCCDPAHLHTKRSMYFGTIHQASGIHGFLYIIRFTASPECLPILLMRLKLRSLRQYSHHLRYPRIPIRRSTAKVTPTQIQQLCLTASLSSRFSSVTDFCPVNTPPQGICSSSSWMVCRSRTPGSFPYLQSLYI